MESFRKVALLMLIHVSLYLAAEQLAPVQAAVKIDNIEKYVITREGRNDTDLFRVVYDNSKCPLNACGSSTAHMINITQCICSCTPGTPTFLPALGLCGDTKTVKDYLFDSCSSFLEWPFFLRSLNLESGGKEEHGNSEHYQSCHVVPQSAAYYNYQVKNSWVDIHSDIFTVEIEGSQVVFKWRPNKDKQLSGRIIRVKISCDYSSRLTKTGCLLFKSSGQITYNLHSVTSSGEVFQAPVFVSSSASSTAPGMTSAVLLPSSSPSVSSLQPSKKTPSISFNPSSSFPSPQPHQTKFVSTTTLLTFATSITVHVEPSVLSTATQESAASVKPTKPSSTNTAPSSSAALDDGIGEKNAQRNGDDKRVIIITIGAVGGGAVILGICVLMIIVFYKRRKLRTNKHEKTTKPEGNDIQMGRSRGKHVMAMNEQDSEPTYQGLIIENGRKLEVVVLHGSSEDNNTVYQSLNKKIPETPVYQSLKKGQNATEESNFKPQPGGTGQLYRRAKVPEEPVYVNGHRQIVAELGNMPEPLYVLESDPEKSHGASESDNNYYGDTQDPLYVVLVGSNSERNSRALGNDNHGYTSDPLYNVLEGPDGNTSNGQPEPLYINVLKGPESQEDPQEPLYNVLESSDAENNPTETEGSYGLSNVTLCNVLKESDSTGANTSSMDYTPSNLPFSLASYDNQSYDQSLEPDVAYGIVRRPQPQRESAYEAVREPDRCDLYEPLSKRRT